MIHRATQTFIAVLCALVLAAPAMAAGTTSKKSTAPHKHKTTHSSSAPAKKTTPHKKSGTTHKKSGAKASSSHTPTTKPK